MSPREIDAQVATDLFGWKFYAARPKFTSDLYLDDRGEIVDLPFFSSQIAAAMEVQYEIHKRRLHLEYAHYLMLEVGIERPAQTAVEAIAWLCANASPRQRCLAALRAVGAEVKEDL